MNVLLVICIKNRAFPIDSANFTMDTPEKVYKALSMEVTHLSLPTKIYNISGELRNNYFRINETVFEVPSGMYKIQELVNVMSIAVNDSGIPIRFYYDSVIDRVYIYKEDPALNQIIEFSHREGCQDMELNTTLGWALGFRMPAYSLDSIVPADGLHYQTVTNQNDLKGNWPNQKYPTSNMPFLRGTDMKTNTTGAPLIDNLLNNWKENPGGVEAIGGTNRLE